MDFCVFSNEHSICELLVQMCMTLAEDNQLNQVKSFVKEHIQPLWENESVSMRAKIRMWDIRDAYRSYCFVINTIISILTR